VSGTVCDFPSHTYAPRGACDEGGRALVVVGGGVRGGAQDLMGSRAHATMLAAQKLITYEDLDAILKGIDEVSGTRGLPG
jgi:argininosuccinate lyase